MHPGLQSLRPDIVIHAPTETSYAIEIKKGKNAPKKLNKRLLAELFAMLLDDKNTEKEDVALNFIKKWLPDKADDKEYVTKLNSSLKEIRLFYQKLIAADTPC